MILVISIYISIRSYQRTIDNKISGNIIVNRSIPDINIIDLRTPWGLPNVQIQSLSCDIGSSIFDWLISQSNFFRAYKMAGRGGCQQSDIVFSSKYLYSNNLQIFVDWRGRAI